MRIWSVLGPSVLLLACDPSGANKTNNPNLPAVDEAEKITADPEPLAPTTAHAFSALDMLDMVRVSDPQVSPDGKSIAFVQRRTDVPRDGSRMDIYTVPVGGGDPVRLTGPSATKTWSPRWADDGKTLFFLSSQTGSTQVFSCNPDGSNQRQVTDLPLPVANLEVVPGGTHLAFSTEVFVDCKDLGCTVDRLAEREQSKRSGRKFNKLFARHWDSVKDGRRSHLFVVPTAGGDPVDLSAGLDADVPSKPFGGSAEFTFSPDGKTAVFTARVEAEREAWSTNFDLYSVPVAGGSPTLLTADNKAWDTQPLFSPDGKTLVWTAMARPGFEADRFVIQARAWDSAAAAPTGEVRALTSSWDRSVGSLSFADNNSLLVTVQNLGQRSLFEVAMADGHAKELAHAGTISNPTLAGDKIVFARHDLQHPTELFALPRAGGVPSAVTHINDARLKLAKTGRAEQFSFKGAKGDVVHGYVVEPVDFDPDKTYPLAFLIHGGPQGSFGNMFHYRWNAQTYAGAGYGVVMIDFHGSTGYGQAFTDAISNDWGGKPLEDLKLGLAHALKQYKWLDGERACALGASYGGFMINWIEGKWPDRFKCLVNHDGVFDNRIMYYATEELWFPEWEHAGPYYANPRAHEKHNPVAHVAKWTTPMLVIHGGRDYRVPPTQGLGAFTALQRRGIESELLFFPDENHWVLRPNNSLQWHETVFAWLARHTATPRSK